MEENIIDRYAWSDAYNTSDLKINQDHKKIFFAANLLHKAIAQHAESAVLDKAMMMLLEYTISHFDREICYFRSIACTVVDDHMELHKTLRDELINLRHSKDKMTVSALSQQLEYWMEKRLLPHIKVQDVLALNSVPNPF